MQMKKVTMQSYHHNQKSTKTRTESKNLLNYIFPCPATYDFISTGDWVHVCNAGVGDRYLVYRHLNHLGLFDNFLYLNLNMLVAEDDFFHCNSGVQSVRQSHHPVLEL